MAGAIELAALVGTAPVDPARAGAAEDNDLTDLAGVVLGGRR